MKAETTYQKSHLRFEALLSGKQAQLDWKKESILGFLLKWSEWIDIIFVLLLSSSQKFKLFTVNYRIEKHRISYVPLSMMPFVTFGGSPEELLTVQEGGHGSATDCLIKGKGESRFCWFASGLWIAGTTCCVVHGLQTKAKVGSDETACLTIELYALMWTSRLSQSSISWSQTE